MKKVSIYILALSTFLFYQCETAEKSQQQTITTDVLIAGGGASGFTAAIQAARMGHQVVIVEETPMLGGMLTASGVSAIDGNHKLPSGLWGEFRQRLYDHYGGPEQVETGWVSNTLFEPQVGDSIIKAMVGEYDNIEVHYGYYLKNALVENDTVKGAIFINEKGNELEVQALVSIDATEYGDLMAMAGADYFTGLDPKSRTGEEIAPEQPVNYIQDLTYVAILKDYGEGAAIAITEPEGYDPDEFACSCIGYCPDSTTTLSCEQMLDYGKLPNNKYMINWPNEGNDYYINALETPPIERKGMFEEAKMHTLRFVYFIQHELGFRNLGLDTTIFDTEDNLAYIPYHRESRRLDGQVMFTINDMLHPYSNDKYKSAVIVGDYPLDHHRDKNPTDIEIDFPPVPSFAIPWGVMIPKEISGLIVAEKSISVSSLANGSTRLQPVVMLIGQAAGVTAALAIENEIPVSQLSVREVQQVLLNSDAWLLPFVDITPEDSAFVAIQQLGVSGVLKGHGVPEAWANRTYIYPDSIMTDSQVKEALKIALTGNTIVDQSTALGKLPEHNFDTKNDLLNFLKNLQLKAEPNGSSKVINSTEKQISRRWFASAVIFYLNPFENIELE